MNWLPDLIGVDTALLLIVTSTLTSMLTAAMGIGGGVLLLAVMATVVPAAALIPVHGLVQLGSNGNRALLTREHIDWSLLRLFLLGAVMGSVVAYFVVVQLPVELIQLCVAGFILFLVWGPKLGKQQIPPAGLVLAGAGTTLLTMFVGATGPLVAAFVHRLGYEKYRVVATFAACMTVQHLLKMVVFGLIGFAFSDWLVLIVMMVMGGFAGTWIGLHILKKVPAERFQIIFRLVVTGLALRLIWQVFSAA
ncbi:sulfite exporter TauE/SafE family protein [Amphritea sp. 1_MG-2023]|uniref:sulfite exporter TauE/SafE family protein n=1 Tax=Amphritea sp. 1_MG-2023 TaxID=3062670 RepID=UPI0026E2FF16|nr:sulfite exporter TauE/SafE family protein [Amphritea sp. 1_MG-2023]MDO6565307.1 sulfite exporter TauE/SafE family protein [Amphritea sp. 1_MG-2023]